MILLRLGWIREQAWLFHRLDRHWVSRIAPAHRANRALADALARQVIRAGRGGDNHACREAWHRRREKDVMAQGLALSLSPLFDLPARRLAFALRCPIPSHNVAHLLPDLQDHIKGRVKGDCDRIRPPWRKVQDL